MSEQFEPVIICFTCNWCSYRAARYSRYSPNALRPQCPLGAADVFRSPEHTFIMKALSGGADGVLITGCHPGECHYIEQNYKAQSRWLLLRRVLKGLGIAPERVKLTWTSAAEGTKLTNEINSFVEEIRGQGPLAWHKNLQQEKQETSQHNPKQAPVEVTV